MKVKLQTLTPLLCLSLLIMSCSDETINLKPEVSKIIDDEISVKSNILTFTSVRSYIDFINDRDRERFNNVRENNNVSLKKALLNNEVKGFDWIDPDDYDRKIYNLVNKDGIIKLGNYIVRLDFANEVSFVTELNGEANIKVLVNKLQSENPNKYLDVFSYPFEESLVDILEICENEKVSLSDAMYLIEKEEKVAGKVAAACPAASGSNDAREQCGDLKYNHNGKGYSAKIKLEYEKFGIYFAVKAKVKNYIVNSVCNIYNDGNQGFKYTDCYINQKKKVCSWFNCHCEDDIQFDWSSTGITITDGSGYDVNSDQYVTTHKAYESTRGLQAYYVSTIMYYSPTGDIMGGKSKSLLIQDI